MATKHTPGPWKRGSCDGFIIWAKRFEATDWADHPSETQERVAIATIDAPAWARVECDYETRERWLAESEANARLVEAAPDMRAVLEWIAAETAPSEGRAAARALLTLGRDAARVVMERRIAGDASYLPWPGEDAPPAARRAGEEALAAIFFALGER